MTLYFRKKVLLAKIESAYGTDATPTGAANAIRATEISIRPMEGSDLDRGHETPYLGANATIPVDVHSVMTFRVELAGSGEAGTAPAWGPLMRACGVAETVTASTDVVYNPISGSFESVTLYLNIDGTLYSLLGARGNCNLTVNASGIPQLEFTFTGLWVKPSSAALPTPDYSAFQKPLAGTKANTPTFTIDGDPYVLRNFQLAFGNDVQGRFLIGEEEIVIADRADMIELQIKAVPLATLDPFALARDQAAVPLQLVHGTGAGNIATLDVDEALIQRPTGITEAQGVAEWPLRMVPLPVSGNDQWTLTLT
ncbi:MULTISPECIES: phage tail tube protein [Salipiger]|uniref:Uncharacterized protein n=1 Tax=Salipiger profundus TaxID=1229727 RepID=A0A1U7CZL4_9RHOB|nr:MULTISPECIES: phage tail tube protein [Salipiger]ALF02051.1 hypothetical protein vBThpSP1_012 [Thiobacimonas phage vB_ThpS-P1]APX21275.1 hypothetical protein Ga0080559_TMP479 [Salipiger profundus]GGA03644.1 hypothetical protein GCM10011326_13780 [Salipiger profundus]